jgi:PAS domain S-box-containing protein
MKGDIAERGLSSSQLTLARYIAALLCVVIGTLLGVWLQPVVDATVFLLMAVLFAAWFGGLWPGLMASVAAALALEFLLRAPQVTLTLPHLAVFIVIAALFASASAGRRKAERSLKQARDELDARVRARTADLQAAHNEAVSMQQRFRELVNSIEGIVWEADARTFQFTFVSQQAERVLGYPVEQWLAEPTFWKDHIHPDDREWAVEYCVSATRQQKAHDFEYRMVAADGPTVWVRDLVNIVIENNQATRLRGVMLDVTARKQAEQALRQQADLLNLTHDTIFVRDMNDVIRYWNRGAEELYGWTSGEAVGQVTHSLMQTIFPAPPRRDHHPPD